MLATGRAASIPVVLDLHNYGRPRSRAARGWPASVAFWFDSRHLAVPGEGNPGRGASPEGPAGCAVPITPLLTTPES